MVFDTDYHTKLYNKLEMMGIGFTEWLNLISASQYKRQFQTPYLLHVVYRKEASWVHYYFCLSKKCKSMLNESYTEAILYYLCQIKAVEGYKIQSLGS